MDLNDLNKVWETKPLKMVREDEAGKILEDIAKQVQPIMRKRKWKVKILSEFWYSAYSLRSSISCPGPAPLLPLDYTYAFVLNFDMQSFQSVSFRAEYWRWC